MSATLGGRCPQIPQLFPGRALPKDSLLANLPKMHIHNLRHSAVAILIDCAGPNTLTKVIQNLTICLAATTDWFQSHHDTHWPPF
jgi:hypothetical protein